MGKSESEDIRILTRFEIENALAKLLFNITASIVHNPYKEYKGKFKDILKIVNKWISYYVENNDLLKMTDEEVIEARSLIKSIPFEAFHIGDFYEEIEIWFDVVVFYGSCPVGEKFKQK